GAAGHLPDRFCGGMEFVLSAGLDFPDLREDFSAAGSGDDDPASGRAKAQSAIDADRRCGPASEMVFLAEGEFDRFTEDGRADGASDGWSGIAALALLER